MLSSTLKCENEIYLLLLRLFGSEREAGGAIRFSLLLPTENQLAMPPCPRVPKLDIPWLGSVVEQSFMSLVEG